MLSFKLEITDSSEIYGWKSLVEKLKANKWDLLNSNLSEEISRDYTLGVRDTFIDLISEIETAIENFKLPVE